MKGVILYLVLLFVAVSVRGSGLSYNYYDEMAQTYCSSRISSPSWVFAIRRNCAGVAATCKDICKSASTDILKKISSQRNNVECFDAIKIRKDHNELQVNPTKYQPDAGKVNMFTYGYGKGGCTWTVNHCGPNYCCCRAF